MSNAVFTRLKRDYLRGKLKRTDLEFAVEQKLISPEEFKSLTGEDFTPAVDYVGCAFIQSRRLRRS